MSFGTIVADCPWQFSNRASRAAAENHYPTMTTREITRLPVEDWAAPNSCLYLWTTDAHLDDAMAVINAWGFAYKMTLVWVKMNGSLQLGLGNYFRHAHELVLFGTRGKPETRDHALPSVFFAPRTKHSAKPEVLQDMAEKLSPGPYLEMFARRQRPGWTAWGNEIPHGAGGNGSANGSETEQENEMAMNPEKRAKLLNEIADSDVTGGGNNLLDGRGRFVVKRFSLEDGYNGGRAVFEFIVVASQKIPVVELKTGKTLDISPNPVASSVSVVNMIEKYKVALGAVKATVLALYNEVPESKEELIEILDELDKNNSAYGMVVDYETFRKITDENKVEIVVPKWSYVEQTKEDIKAMQNWIEALTTGQPAVTA